MDILQAKLQVIDAGLRLVKNGLIARTWGNVSCRVSDTQFVITPSGRAYEGLTPDEIVLMNINDLSYDGEVKPSGEKGIHAAAYQLRPEVQFVIHTHQRNASMVSVMQKDITDVPSPWAELVGGTVPMAAYGLPSTGKLRRGVAASLLDYPESKAIIMAHHGAMCVGASYEEAFQITDALEHVCAQFLSRRLLDLTGEAIEGVLSIHEKIAALRANRRAKPSAPEFKAYSSFRSGDAFCMKPEDGEGAVVDVSLPTGEIFEADEAVEYPDSLELHRVIYQKNKRINAIVHSRQPEIVWASQAGKKLKPYLDDFAQIAGINLRVARFNPLNQLESAVAVNKLLRRREAVLLEDNGALCVGVNEDEARAVEMVVEKNSATSLAADLFEKVKTINVVESALMRFIYKKKYSKQK
ncbi:MAG: class II aldolase/adducin family protein [Oscillospiraceae bacterium]|nr:class II aldolase/adducin family protein [Oscillospiraceae bacterium]